MSKDSPLLRSLTTEGFQVYGCSLIEFSALELGQLPVCDWIFFYSSNGVRFLLEGLGKIGATIPARVKLGTMGRGTAATLSALFRKPDFVGSGKPDETARAFLREAEGQTVLFARALRSAKSIQNLLAPYINIIDLPVYKNEQLSQAQIPVTDYVILTSPMNVDVFFKNRKPEPQQVFIAIGKPTALRYAHWIRNKIYIPEHPSEQALADLILELERKKGGNE